MNYWVDPSPKKRKGRRPNVFNEFRLARTGLKTAKRDVRTTPPFLLSPKSLPLTEIFDLQDADEEKRLFR
jgi:hypothetical protein